jgi:hypothetical protein
LFSIDTHLDPWAPCTGCLHIHFDSSAPCTQHLHIQTVKSAPWQLRDLLWDISQIHSYVHQEPNIHLHL